MLSKQNKSIFVSSRIFTQLSAFSQPKLFRVLAKSLRHELREIHPSIHWYHYVTNFMKYTPAFTTLKFNHPPIPPHGTRSELCVSVFWGALFFCIFQGDPDSEVTPSSRLLSPSGRIFSLPVELTLDFHSINGHSV
jgi:hypothetical protein